MVGPGGGGGGTSMPTTPVPTTNKPRVQTTPRATNLTVTVDEMLVRNQDLTEDYLIPLELRDDDTFTEVDRQKALQT